MHVESGLEEVEALSAASQAFDVFFLGNEVVFYDGALEVLKTSVNGIVSSR